MVSISSKWLKWIRKKNNTSYYQFFIDVPVDILKKRNTRNIYKKKYCSIVIENNKFI